MTWVVKNSRPPMSAQPASSTPFLPPCSKTACQRRLASSCVPSAMTDRAASPCENIQAKLQPRTHAVLSRGVGTLFQADSEESPVCPALDWGGAHGQHEPHRASETCANERAHLMDAGENTSEQEAGTPP